MKRYIKYLALAAILFTIAVPLAIRLFGAPAINSFNASGAEERAGDDYTLVFCYGSNDLKDSLRNSIALFEEQNPGVSVKIRQLPGSTNLQKDYYTQALFSGDSSIDVFLSDLVWTFEFAAAGWIMPLDDYFDEALQQEFISNALESCRYKGSLYAIPYKIDIPMLYYRSDIIPAPPKTITELIQLCKTHRSANSIKYGYVFQAQSYEGLVCTALEFIWNNGGTVIDDGLVTINTPEAVEGLQLLVDIINSDVATSDVLNFQEEDSRIAFQDGNALFMRNWLYADNFMSSPNSRVRGKYSVAPLPLGPEGTRSRGTLGGFGYMINSNSKNLRLAWEFVEWMSGYEAQYDNAQLKVAIPARKGIYGDVKLQIGNPLLNAVSGMIADSGLRPLSPHYSSISESLQVNFNNAVRGKISARAAIENIENDLIHINSLDKEQ